MSIANNIRTVAISLGLVASPLAAKAAEMTVDLGTLTNPGTSGSAVYNVFNNVQDRTTVIADTALSDGTYAEQRIISSAGTDPFDVAFDFSFAKNSVFYAYGSTAPGSGTLGTVALFDNGSLVENGVVSGDSTAFLFDPRTLTGGLGDNYKLEFLDAKTNYAGYGEIGGVIDTTVASPVPVPSELPALGVTLSGLAAYAAYKRRDAATPKSAL